VIEAFFVGRRDRKDPDRDPGAIPFLDREVGAGLAAFEEELKALNGSGSDAPGSRAPKCHLTKV
jgi:hypothetical protein